MLLNGCVTKENARLLTPITTGHFSATEFKVLLSVCCAKFLLESCLMKSPLSCWKKSYLNAFLQVCQVHDHAGETVNLWTYTGPKLNICCCVCEREGVTGFFFFFQI